VVAAEGNRGENVFFIARNDDTDRNLAVIGAVGCVEGPAARVEADLSAKVAAESGFKRGGVELRGMGRGWGDILRHRVQNIFEDAGAVRKGRKESAHEGCVAQAPSPAKLCSSRSIHQRSRRAGTLMGVAPGCCEARCFSRARRRRHTGTDAGRSR
jgi:hypothetical protein